MNKLGMLTRILLGLIFFVFGLNGFLNFIPQPPQPETAAAFFGGLFQTGYFLPFLKGCEVVCGILLLTNLYVPLALLVLSPIVVQIFLFHLFLAPSGLPVALVLVVAMVIQGRVNWHLFKPVVCHKR